MQDIYLKWVTREQTWEVGGGLEFRLDSLLLKWIPKTVYIHNSNKYIYTYVISYLELADIEILFPTILAIRYFSVAYNMSY
jgi:hypothetical protein